MATPAPTRDRRLEVRTTARVAAIESPAKPIKEAIASTRLEGLDLSDAFLADADLAAAGVIDEDELVARTLSPHQR